MSGGYFDRIPPGFYVGPDGRLMADRLFPTTEKESDMTAPKTAPPEFDGDLIRAAHRLETEELGALLTDDDVTA